MHAASQPARAPGQPPAGSWQDGGCQLRMVLGRSNDHRRARMHGERFPLHLRAPVVIRSPYIYDLNFQPWGTQYRHAMPPIAA